MDPGYRADRINEGEFMNDYPSHKNLCTMDIALQQDNPDEMQFMRLSYNENLVL